MSKFALPRIGAALSALVMGVALATAVPAEARTAHHPAKASVTKVGGKHAKAGKAAKHAKAGKHAKGAKHAKHAKHAKRTKAKMA